MIKVLINDSFKKFLINQPPEYRRKVRQKFEYLEIGYWEGGLKVKKIKSLASNKAIFEARLDRANRILFTLGTDKENASENLLIYIWGIVGHDDISHGSRNIPTNVPFLQFKPYEEESSKETLFEDLEEAYFTQESITQKVADDSASQRWHFLEKEDWQRIEDYREDDFELALYLTPEQQEVLNKPLPLLVSGTAGSGKTTIGIYYLLKLSLAKEKKLFVTYNKYLKNAALKLYHGLLNATPFKNEFIDPDFFTFKDYCLRVAEHYRRTFSPEKEVNFEKFNELMLSHSQAQKFDAPLIWEEIRSIIKGALPQINVNIVKQALQKIESGQISAGLLQALQQQFHIFAQLQSLHKVGQFVQKYLDTNISTFSKNISYYLETRGDRLLTTLDRTLNLLEKERELTQKKYLSFVDYEALGKKKAPNFQFDRKQIYQIFEWYQDKLNREELWDELDLTREAMNLLNERESEAQRYGLVVCDEVQDLTDVQHQLLFYIVRNPLNLLLCGDTKQIINPSGFRWEELKRHLYEREIKIPEICFLSLNFRSSGSIVELSNTLLELKSALLGSRTEELKEDWKYKGRPPVVVKNVTEQTMLKNVRSTGAKKTILVRTEEEKRRLQKFLETELIFTIYEAKGLEFDTVLLWKFCSDVASNDVWKVILQESSRAVHQAKIKYEINLLYVAITRAQRDLLIYDVKQPSLIWNSDLIRNKIYATEDLSYIGNIWNIISTPEEWREQGDYFFEREYYKAAMECYKNAGEEKLLLKAKAYDAEKRQKFHLAATSFEKIGELEKAATHFEKSENYDKAFLLWKKLKNREGASRCHLKLLEHEGRYDELAKLYLSRKDYPKAFDMLVRAGMYEKAAEVSLKHLKDLESAAGNYEKARRYQKAAQLYQKIKNLEKAAELYEQAKDYGNAQTLWKRLKRQDRLIPLYHKTENYPELLRIYEKARNFDKGVAVLKKIPAGAELQTQATELFKSRKYFPALIRFYVLNDYSSTAECYFKLKNYAEAGRYYELADNPYQAALCYQKAKENRAAFVNFLQSEEDRQNDFAHARRISRRIVFSEIEELGHKFYKQKQYELAAVCFALTDNHPQTGICYLENNQPEKTREYWQKCLSQGWMLETIARYCLRNRQVDFGAQFILDQPRNAFHFLYQDFGPTQQDSLSLFKLMDEYFANHPNKKEMLKWVDIMGNFGFDVGIETEKLMYVEKSGDYNRYFNDLKDFSYYFPEFLQALKKEFRREYKKLVNDYSEISAIKLYFLDKQDDFNRVVQRLELTEDNYEIFAESDLYEKAIDLMLEKGKYYDLKWILIQKNEFLRLAQISEKCDFLGVAAHYYGVHGDYLKSATLYEKIEKFYKAGEAYYKASSYQKALEMFIKSGKGKAKIAQTHEKLGQYAEAATIWKELGKTKKYQKCVAKLQEKNLTLFD
jgi:superfamily I DNA/RNA helicase/tetratricopeptide (TPR) repeat protein